MSIIDGKKWDEEDEVENLLIAISISKHRKQMSSQNLPECAFYNKNLPECAFSLLFSTDFNGFLSTEIRKNDAIFYWSHLNSLLRIEWFSTDHN